MVIALASSRPQPQLSPDREWGRDEGREGGGVITEQEEYSRIQRAVTK